MYPLAGTTKISGNCPQFLLTTCIKYGVLAVSDSFVSTDGKRFSREAIEAAIRVGFVFLLVLWRFDTVRPFILLAVWAGSWVGTCPYPYDSILPGYIFNLAKTC